MSLEMSTEQEDFMEEVQDEMDNRIAEKFPKGVAKYGTTLHKDHTVAFLHEMAMDELTDLPTYMIALKKRVDEAVALLESCDCDTCKKVLEILR